MGDAIYKERHHALGLCLWCSRKAVPGEVLCERHTLTHRQSTCEGYKLHREERYKKIRWHQARLTAQGKCYKCGTPLIEGEGSICTNCMDVVIYGAVKGVVR